MLPCSCPAIWSVMVCDWKGFRDQGYSFNEQNTPSCKGPTFFMATLLAATTREGIKNDTEQHCDSSGTDKESNNREPSHHRNYRPLPFVHNNAPLLTPHTAACSQHECLLIHPWLHRRQYLSLKFHSPPKSTTLFYAHIWPQHTENENRGPL